MNVSMVVFWVVTPCRFVNRYRHFQHGRSTLVPTLQSIWRHNPEQQHGTTTVIRTTNTVSLAYVISTKWDAYFWVATFHKDSTREGLIIYLIPKTNRKLTSHKPYFHGLQHTHGPASRNMHFISFSTHQTKSNLTTVFRLLKWVRLFVSRDVDS